MEIANTIKSLSYSPGKGKQWLMHYGPILVTGLLVIWVAAKLVDLTWLLMEKPVYDSTPATLSGAAPAPTSEGTASKIQVIRSSHLFGQYVAPVIPVDTGASADNLEEFVPGDYTLKGTVASNSEDKGLAIIENRGDELVFMIGDTIAPGVELKRVLAREIHVMHAGVTKKMLLPSLADATPTNNRSGSNRRTETVLTTPARTTASNRAQGPAKLGDLLRPQPVFQNGKQLGYRVYPGRKRDQFKALGLKPGDLVTEINGTPLDDPSRGMQIFRSLNDSTQVSVTIQRNGAQTSLVLDTSQLNLGQ